MKGNNVIIFTLIVLEEQWVRSPMLNIWYSAFNGELFPTEMHFNIIISRYTVIAIWTRVDTRWIGTMSAIDCARYVLGEYLPLWAYLETSICIAYLFVPTEIRIPTEMPIQFTSHIAEYEYIISFNWKRLQHDGHHAFPPVFFGCFCNRLLFVVSCSHTGPETRAVLTYIQWVASFSTLRNIITMADLA